MPLRLDLTPTPEEYEDGVAEVLKKRFAGQGTVERDVRLPGRSGGIGRQIDILVRLRIADIGEELILVDCKRYGRKVDIGEIDNLIGMVQDVGAAMGMLVTNEGYTEGASRAAKAAPGIHIDVVRLEDLPRWEPPFIVCELCRDAIGEDAMLGMAYVDHIGEVETEEGGGIEVTVGYCEKCNGLHIECPKCETINAISDLLTDEWFECEGGCGLEFHLRREAYKDDLVNPTHDRLTVRLPA